MHELLQNNKPFVWSTDCNSAFLKAKELISSDKVLMRYTPELPLRLACDASPYGIAAVLAHITDSSHITYEERPIAYASRTLTKAKNNYSKNDKSQGSSCNSLGSQKVLQLHLQLSLHSRDRPSTSEVHFQSANKHPCNVGSTQTKVCSVSIRFQLHNRVQIIRREC